MQLSASYNWVDNCESGVVKQVSTIGGLSQLQGSGPGIVGDSIPFLLDHQDMLPLDDVKNVFVSVD
jgi:hypothetical protein